MSNAFIKTIDNSSVLDNVIQAAIERLATTTAVSTAIVASSLIPLPNTWTSTNSFNNDVKLNSNLILPIGQYSNTLDIVGWLVLLMKLYFWLIMLQIVLPSLTPFMGQHTELLLKTDTHRGFTMLCSVVIHMLGGLLLILFLRCLLGLMMRPLTILDMVLVMCQILRLVFIPHPHQMVLEFGTIHSLWDIHRLVFICIPFFLTGLHQLALKLLYRVHLLLLLHSHSMRKSSLIHQQLIYHHYNYPI
jgi:hypothetical protein